MRGGKRPGAGAPKGNINHLKHGRRSKTMKAIVAMLHDPEKRQDLVEFAKKNSV